MADVQILPPGPSPEFLRRSAMYEPPQYGTTASSGSFDPATGVRESQTFNTQVAPPATSEMQMLESIRHQVNAMHFKNAQDAMNAAVQFQHMREAQRMREAGANEEQILGRLGRGLFYQQPNVLPQMINQTRPVPPPAIEDHGGIPVLRSGLRGERATTVSQSALPAQPLPTSVREIPIEKEDGTISEDEYAVPSANGKGLVVRRRAQKKDSVTPGVRQSILKQQIEGAQKELDSHILLTKKERESQQVKNRKLALEQRISKAQSDMDAMLEGPAATTGYVIGKTYKGGLKYLGGDPSDESSWEKVK